MRKGSKHTSEAKLKSRLAKLGKPRSGNPKSWKHSPETRVKIGVAVSKPRPFQIGNKNPNWKGGVSPLVKVIRESSTYKDWRTSVYARDNYTCQMCEVIGGEMQVDHIKPFSAILRDNNIETFQEALACTELWDLSNGRVLCVTCHRATPTYAGRSIKYPTQQSLTPT